MSEYDDGYDEGCEDGFDEGARFARQECADALAAAEARATAAEAKVAAVEKLAKRWEFLATGAGLYTKSLAGAADALRAALGESS